MHNYVYCRIYMTYLKHRPFLSSHLLLVKWSTNNMTDYIDNSFQYFFY